MLEEYIEYYEPFANLLILNRLRGDTIVYGTASVLLFLCMHDGHLSPVARFSQCVLSV